MAEKLEPGINDLETTHPGVAAQWDKNKNPGLEPSTVLPGSGKHVWWLCTNGHSTEAEVRGRVKFGCGICGNRELLSGFNDLQTRFPEIAKEWDFSNNKGLLPSQLMYGAKQSANWVCERSHSWSASIGSRTSNLLGCPYCTNRRAWPGSNDLETLFPNLAAEYDSDKNHVSARDVIPHSPKRRFWLCGEGHSYEVAPVNRVHGSGCPYCAGKKVLLGFNDLQTTNPELSEEWDFARNQKSPTQVNAGSHKKTFWLCPEGHSYTAAIKDRSRGTGCNICSGRNVLAGYNDFASNAPGLAAEWDYTKNEGTLPTEITRWNESKFWWICDKGHSYEATPGNRFMGKGCAVCYNRQIQIGVNDLESQFPELILEWDYQKNHDLSPSQFVRGSAEKVWWHCPNGHSYKTSISNRAIVSVGCPDCANAGYSTVRAGILYYIHHPQLLASKVGITNQQNRHSRLEGFAKEGWEEIQKWEDPNGLIILEAETQILRWLRKDLGLLPFLSSKEVGKMGGWSETFATDGVLSKEVIEKIQAVMDSLRDQDSEAL